MDTDMTVRPGEADLPVYRLAEGTQLVGEYQGSAFQEPKFLVTRADGQVMQLPGLLYKVLGSLDGRTPEQVAAELNAELGDQSDEQVTAEDVAFVVEKQFRPLGLIARGRQGSSGAEEASGPPPFPVRADPLLALRFRVGVVPASVASRIAGVFGPLFARPVWPLALVSFLAVDVWIIAQGDLLGRATAGVQSMIRTPVLVLAVLAVTVVGGAFHEWGHITACRYGGARPGDVGVGIYIVWPAFYSTVTDSYRLDRKGRLRTDLGGVYFDAIFMALLGVVYLRTGEPWLLIALIGGHVETVWQFLPSLRLDGYYILADLVGVPELFGYVKAALQSLLPGRAAPAKLRELKPRARRVVVLWVALVVPALAAGAAVFVLAAPTVLPAVLRSVGQYLGRIQSAARAGDLVGTSLDVVQVFFLLLPWVGTALLLRTMVTRGARWATSRSGAGRVPVALRSAVRTSLQLMALAGIGTALVLRVAHVAATHPATAEETRLIDSALAASRGLYGSPAVPIGVLPARDQLAWYARLTGSFGRHSMVLTAGRELAVVATAVLVASLVALVVAGRLRPLAAGLPMLAVLAMGPAVILLATVGPGVVGAAWVALGAVLLACTCGRSTAFISAVLIAVGLVTAPVIAVPLAAGVGVLLKGKGREGRERPDNPATRHTETGNRGVVPRRWMVALLVLPAAGLVVAAATGDVGGDPLAQPERTLLFLAAGGTVIIALVARRNPPVTVAAAVALALGHWPMTGQVAPVALVMAVLLAALLVDGLIRRPVVERPRAILRAVTVVPLTVFVAVGALFLPGSAPPIAHAQLAAWVAGPSSADGTVAVPVALWGQLIADGVPANRLRVTGAEGERDAAWRVTMGTPHPGVRPQAAFGRAPTVLTVEQTPAARAAAQARAEAQARAQAAAQQGVQASAQTVGALLAADHMLSGPPDIMTAVAQGRLDNRALAVLAALAATHSVSLGTPPSAGATGDGLSHALLITSLDGRFAARPQVRETLADILRGLGPATADARVTVGRAGITVAWT